MTAFSLMALILMASISGGCDEPRRLSLDRKEDGFIAFVGNAKDDPVWQVLSATAQRYRAGTGGFDLKVLAADTATPSAQMRLLRELHDPRMRGLCIWPTDTLIMKDILLDLRTKGVPIVTMVTPILTREPFVHSGLDDFAIGRAMANAAFEAVKEKGTLAVLRDGSGLRHHADRYLGFAERARQRPSMTILTTLECMNNTFVGQRMVREYTERFPRLNAWVTIDDWPLRDLKPGEILLPKTCSLITYGPYPDYWPLVNGGTCYALVGAEYDKIAEHALEMCVTLARGEVLENKEFFAEPITLSKKNLQEFRIQWFKWLDSK
ncbi:MAG: sugar ABC transporter substrate-binding protein [Planctomycetes bacterium]|nr:sugar ABC transporter substrate-binding protein [Planctomycetota bacterium]